MGIFNKEQSIKNLKEDYMIETVIYTKEYTLPVDVEFGSRTTDHIRFKFKPNNQRGSKFSVSVGIDNGEVKIFNGKFDKKLSKNDINRIFKFVELEWDIIVNVYVRNLDQQIAKQQMLNRLQEYNNQCELEGRKEDKI